MGELKPKVEKHSVNYDQPTHHFVSYSLQIIEYGSVVTQSDNPYGERFSHYHRLNYILEGEPYYYDGTSRIALEPGCLVYLPPNMNLGISPDCPPVKLLFVNFILGALDMVDDFRSFMGNLFENQHVHDSDGQLRRIMEEIQRIGMLNQPYAGIEIQNLFENLFFHLVRMSGKQHPPHHNTGAYGSRSNLVRAMAYINANIRRNFRMSEMASSLNISENYLYKIITSQTGKTPTELITGLRMDIARSALANPNLPVKTIAANLGYGSVSHFSNVFKKEYGFSPSEYRRQLANDHRVGRGRSPENAVRVEPVTGDKK